MLPKPISLYLFNGSHTPSGVITHAINLTITVHGFAPKEVVYYLTKLHKLTKLVLGLSWLCLENPLVDWVALTVSPRSLQFPTGRSQPETFSTIPELHLQDPTQVVPTHMPPTVPSHPAMATLSSIDLKPCNFDSTIVLLCFVLPYFLSGTTTWYPTLTTLSEDPMEDNPSMVSDEDTEDSTPNLDLDTLPKPSEVRITGAAAFSTLMKQGCFWGLIVVSDLLHADAQAMLRAATPNHHRQLWHPCLPRNMLNSNSRFPNNTTTMLTYSLRWMLHPFILTDHTIIQSIWKRGRRLLTVQSIPCWKPS